MGAGSAKGVNEFNDEDDPENDRFSIISGGSPTIQPKLPKPIKPEVKINKEPRTSIRAKIEALGAESEDDDLPKSADDGDRKEDERRKGLFGFSRKKSDDEKTNAFVHENGDETKRSIKRESSKGFRFFKFRKEDKKFDEKDEILDQEIKDLQQAFDSLGIVGSNVWTDNSKKDIISKKSQSADDIRELEPMRNRLNQKRRFSRPANVGGSIRSGVISTPGGGKRRTFKYSWEKENLIASPVRTEDWNYEATIIEGFDVNKFKEVNKDGPNIMSGNFPEGNNNSDGWGSPLFSGTPNGIKSPPLTYDPAEQKLLASIEREFV